jgi:prephenate dehydrogenase
LIFASQITSSSKLLNLKFMAIRQITIIGTGLIGGSLGLALRKKKFAGRIVGCDRKGTLEHARMRGAIDDGTANPGDAVRGSQIIVLATPVLAIVDLIERLGPVLPAKALLTDVGSTKAAVVDRALKVFAKNAGKRFLAGHPMAGKEMSGLCGCGFVSECCLVSDTAAGAEPKRRVIR